MLRIANRPSWYTKSKFIRTRKNHQWTEQEMKQVYSLRIQRVPIDLIIEKLHLNVRRVQVYNILRMLKKNQDNKCFQCGEDLNKEEQSNQNNKFFKKCDSCKKKNHVYKKRKRRNNIKEGICGYCGRNRILEGKKACIYCLSYSHRQHISKGLCGNCGKSPISPRSISSCDYCMVLNRNQVHMSRIFKLSSERITEVHRKLHQTEAKKCKSLT